jgi:ADP-ribose pyrophosphatase YjhB (NUDIX family)
VSTTPPRHSVSVSGVIPDGHGHVLLIRRRDNQHWGPPGGVLELAESIHDGLRREIREETGLDIEPGPLTGVYKNMPRSIVALVFRCKMACTTQTSTSDTTSPSTSRSSKTGRTRASKATPGHQPLRYDHPAHPPGESEPAPSPGRIPPIADASPALHEIRGSACGHRWDALVAFLSADRVTGTWRTRHPRCTPARRRGRARRAVHQGRAVNVAARSTWIST